MENEHTESPYDELRQLIWRCGNNGLNESLEDAAVTRYFVVAEMEDQHGRRWLRYLTHGVNSWDAKGMLAEALDDIRAGQFLT
jgi:hypothetical protein